MYRFPRHGTTQWEEESGSRYEAVSAEQKDQARKLKILDSIQATMAPEIERMNSIILSLLHTDHELVNGIVENYLKTKGKQIRPILVMLAARMFGSIDERVLNCAAALEMLHNATLIHDDVVDQTPLRRGEPTINAVWGNHIAVLIGDLFVSKALEAGVKTGNLAILKTLSDLGTDLSLGEMSQLFNARFHDFNDEAYYEMISKKTASLFMGCVRIGCQAVGAPEEEMELLEEYAYLMGMAFQIRDDIFDYFPSEDIGKPSGHDLTEGKVTLPLLYALEHGPSEQAEKIRKILTGDEPLSSADISEMQEFAKANGGIEAACERMEFMKREGSKLLKKLPDNRSRSYFEEIFDYIIERRY